MTDFKIKYEIIKRYLPVDGSGRMCRRTGERMSRVGFITSHDTGNPTSTAINNITHYTNSFYLEWAGAHIFVDDTGIYECIPWLTVPDDQMEKAMHVIYNVTKDNEIYGDDANDISGGIELCYGGKIDPHEAYKRYLWVHAYAIHRFKLNPLTDITGHFILDPARKTDPKSGLLNSLGITFEQFILDVVEEYKDCTGAKPMELKDWQWTMLGNKYNELYIKSTSGEFPIPLLTDYTWAQKAYSGTLVADEVIWLEAIINARYMGIKVD